MHETLAFGDNYPASFLLLKLQVSDDLPCPMLQSDDRLARLAVTRRVEQLQFEVKLHLLGIRKRGLGEACVLRPEKAWHKGKNPKYVAPNSVESCCSQVCNEMNLAGHTSPDAKFPAGMCAAALKREHPSPFLPFSQTRLERAP
jgi:hypothetical protein